MLKKILISLIFIISLTFGYSFAQDKKDNSPVTDVAPVTTFSKLLFKVDKTKQSTMTILVLDSSKNIMFKQNHETKDSNDSDNWRRDVTIIQNRLTETELNDIQNAFINSQFYSLPESKPLDNSNEENILEIQAYDGKQVFIYTSILNKYGTDKDKIEPLVKLINAVIERLLKN